MIYKKEDLLLYVPTYPERLGFLWGTFGWTYLGVFTFANLWTHVFLQNYRLGQRMDIKQALNSILPLQLRAKNKVEKSIKSDSTTDRDANGQQSFGGGQQHPPMSDEHLKKAMKHLEE